MTWKQARIIAAQHAARLQIPRDLRGVVVQITDYPDEETLRFLKPEEPDITLAGHRMINQALSRETRKRGARVEFVTVKSRDYFDWLTRFHLDDCAAGTGGLGRGGLIRLGGPSYWRRRAAGPIQPE